MRARPEARIGAKARRMAPLTQGQPPEGTMDMAAAMGSKRPMDMSGVDAMENNAMGGPTGMPSAPAPRKVMPVRAGGPNLSEKGKIEGMESKRQNAAEKKFGENSPKAEAMESKKQLAAEKKAKVK